MFDKVLVMITAFKEHMSQEGVFSGSQEGGVCACMDRMGAGKKLMEHVFL